MSRDCHCAPSRHRQKEPDLLGFPSVIYGGAKRSLWMFSIESAWASAWKQFSAVLLSSIPDAFPKSLSQGEGSQLTGLPSGQLCGVRGVSAQVSVCEEGEEGRVPVRLQQ